jgi:hypothetical protein
LLDYPWITVKDSISAPDVLQQYFGRANIEAPPFSVTTTSVQSGFRLLRRNHYLMMVSGSILGETAALRIKPLHVRGKLKSFTAGLIYRPSTIKLRPHARFRELVLKHAHGLPGTTGIPRPTDTERSAEANREAHS